MLLKVEDLRVAFHTPSGTVQAVGGVSFELNKGEVLGIVGESGSGKSVTAYTILQLLPKNNMDLSGSVQFEGQELIGAPEQLLQRLRGNRISMIFQDPMTSLNPTHTIGWQLMEAILLHTDRNKAQARRRAVELLELVKVSEPEKRLKQYPHSLSGGQRQRVMIAMALACEPDILIADEPTTALDVTIQAQILELLDELRKELGMAIILITHDLGVVARMCDRVLVMYAGTVCEEGSVYQLLEEPRHEYTKGLLRSVPAAEGDEPLQPIPGSPVDLADLPPGCPFADRCPEAMQVCLEQKCPWQELKPGHFATCWVNPREAEKHG